MNMSLKIVQLISTNAQTQMQSPNSNESCAATLHSLMFETSK